MNKEQEILGMARVLCGVVFDKKECATCGELPCEFRNEAEKLYGAGYRKIAKKEGANV